MLVDAGVSPARTYRSLTADIDDLGRGWELLLERVHEGDVVTITSVDIFGTEAQATAAIASLAARGATTRALDTT